jgi:hypothetical protein
MHWISYINDLNAQGIKWEKKILIAEEAFQRDPDFVGPHLLSWISSTLNKSTTLKT